jgi:hypothetical protein
MMAELTSRSHPYGAKPASNESTDSSLSSYLRYPFRLLGSWKLGSAKKRSGKDPGEDRPPASVEDVELQTRQNVVPPMFLFLCVTTQRAYTRTQKTNICIQSDNDESLFRRIRVEFNRTMGSWRRVLALRKLKEIRFVKVWTRRCLPQWCSY